MHTLPLINTREAPADPVADAPRANGAGADSVAKRRFARFSAFVLLYNLPVIVFGAFVRVTKSGDGCGSHWPACNGQVVPLVGETKTLIEFTHRLMSGLDGLLVLALFAGALFVFPRGHRVRKAAIFSLFFTLVEAAIGAALVKNGWVVDDASAGRAVTLSLHLVNTFLLLAALTLTAWWARPGRAPLQLRGGGALGAALAAALVATLVLGVSGAVTALGDTLFPVRGGTLEAVRDSLTPGAHFLVRLRIYHPLIAIAVGVYLVAVAAWAVRLRPGSPAVRAWGRAACLLFLVQIGAGFLNKALMAPTWMQLVHLLLADVLWVSIVLLAVTALEAPAAAPAPAARREYEAPVAGPPRAGIGGLGTEGSVR